MRYVEVCASRLNLYHICRRKRTRLLARDCVSRFFFLLNEREREDEREESTDFHGHRFLLKSSTRDCDRSCNPVPSQPNQAEDGGRHEKGGEEDRGRREEEVQRKGRWTGESSIAIAESRTSAYVAVYSIPLYHYRIPAVLRRSFFCERT